MTNNRQVLIHLLTYLFHQLTTAKNEDEEQEVLKQSAVAGPSEQGAMKQGATGPAEMDTTAIDTFAQVCVHTLLICRLHIQTRHFFCDLSQ